VDHRTALRFDSRAPITFVFDVAATCLMRWQTVRRHPHRSALDAGVSVTLENCAFAQLDSDVLRSQ
jgi:hypothetical protein